MKHLAREPYRLFFPLGALYAFWGVVVWIIFGTGLSHAYPGALHAQVMIGGFLGAFATGFLMTAIPRFTQTYPARSFELLMTFTPLAAFPFILLLGGASWALLASLISLLSLVAFAGERFLKRKNRPPHSFVFLGFGILSGVVGLFLQLFAEGGLVNPSWGALGRLLYLHCFLLSLVIGVGSRLIPALLTWGPPPNHPEFINAGRAKLNPFIVLGLLFVGSYIVEQLLSQETGRWIRALVVAWIAFRYWMIHKLPSNPTKVARGIWISAWCTFIGITGSAIVPNYNIHFLHVALVSGLGLMTLMIATRVTLAHGGFNLALESKLPSLTAITGVLLASGIVRLGAASFPSLYMHGLVCASILWLIGLSVWMVVIGRRIVFSAKAVAHSEDC